MRARAEALLKANILANGNHPSILTWSIGNELPPSATAGEASYVAGATALAHQLDPTRPVSLAISSFPGVPCQTAYLPLDLIGYNDYFGWFSAGGGSTDDRDSLGPFLDTLHACYPGQAMMVSEFGFDANRHGPVEERGTYEFQSDSGIRPAEQRRLAADGETVRVYIPYGDEWYGYLMRRLAERPANLAFFLRALASRS